MSAEEDDLGPEEEPEEMDDEFDPFAEHAHDPPPQEGEEGDDRVLTDSEGGT